MIYSDSLLSSKQEFEHLLEATKRKVLETIDINEINSGGRFEKFVFNAILTASKGTSFENRIYQTADREFPDVVVNGYWGIEIKFTKDDKWKSIGNSVLESSRIPNVEKIYLFFGKCGGIPDIKYRNYDECLSGIAVTHYPRYEIDMNLEIGKSIFDKMGVSYNELRKSSQPAKFIKKFYKENLKENSSLWWIDDPETSARDLEIRFFSDLNTKLKHRLIAEGFVLFPEVLSSKFAKLCAFWINMYSVVCPNMRDHYSASGRVELNNEELEFIEDSEIRRVYYNLLFKYKYNILAVLDEIDLNIISECWEQEISSREYMKKEWCYKIEEYLFLSLKIPLLSYFGIE